MPYAGGPYAGGTFTGAAPTIPLAASIAGKASVSASLSLQASLTARTASCNQLSAGDSEFESGVGNWLNSGGAATFATSAVRSRSGTQSLLYTVTTASAYMHPFLDWHKSVPVSPGDYVRVAASLFLSRAQHVQLRADYINGLTGITSVGTAEVQTAAGQWVDVVAEFGPIPANVNVISPGIQFAAPLAGDTFNIDSVYVGVERSTCGQAGVTGTLTPQRNMRAQIAGRATVVANATRINGGWLAATPNGTSTVAAAGVTAHVVTAGISGAAAVTAAIGRVRTLAASSAGKAALTAAGGAIRTLTASIQGKAAAGGTVSPLRAISAQIAGLGAVVGDLARAYRLAASMQGRGAITGAAVLAHPIAAVIAGKAAITAKVTPLRGLRADTVGSGNQLSAVNSSFETGIGNWQVQNAGGASTLASSNVRARTGTSSLLWTITTPGAFMHPFMSYPSAMPVAAGRYVVVAASVYLSRAQHVQLRADFVNGLNGIGSAASAEVQTPAGQWVDMVVVLGPVPAGAIGAVPGVQLAAPQAGDTVNIDAVSVSVGIAAGGTAAVTATLNASWKLTSQISAGATVTGKSWPLRAISAQCTGVATVRSDLGRRLPFATSCAGLATAVAGLTPRRGLAAQLANAATFGGQLQRDRGLRSTMQGTASFTAALTRYIGASSDVDGGSIVDGDLTASRVLHLVGLAADVAGQGAVDAELTLFHALRALQASASGTGSCTADLSAPRSMSASVSGAGSINADLARTFTLAAHIAGLALAMGQLGKLGPLAGAADGQASFVASLRRAFRLSVVLTGYAVITGDVTGLQAMAARLLAEATVDAALGRIRILEYVDLAGVAVVTGDLPVWHPFDAETDGVAEVVAQQLRRRGAVPVVITTSVDRTAALTLA